MRVALELQYNAIVDKSEDYCGTTLMQAAMYGDTEMMSVLMDAVCRRKLSHVGGRQHFHRSGS